ncbi:hypothetical protein [Variovorax sp. GB1P17]|uniref:hypothetical protein n=1 Tax=Variovorax sp. GB1P17 TaxID=3443740 RepID=UPI003F485C07
MTLDEYFEEIDAPLFAELGLLPREEATELTESLSGHPLVETLQGFALDDPDTSDHHLLLGRAPLEGCVLFLAHDGQSRVVFDSLDSFLQAAREAGEQGDELRDLHPEGSPVASDQRALSALINDLLDDGTLTDVVVALIPSLDLLDLALLERLANDEDFFLGEAVAVEIARRPTQALALIAQMCAAHPHTQVAQAGKRATERVARVLDQP